MSDLKKQEEEKNISSNNETLREKRAKEVQYPKGKLTA